MYPHFNDILPQEVLLNCQNTVAYHDKYES